MYHVHTHIRMYGATFSRMAMVLPNVGGVRPQVFRKCI